MVIYRENNFKPYMQDVEKYSGGLAELDNRWESVKLLCEINCPEQARSIMPNMVNIQSNFSSLQNELINSLISETLKKTYKKMRSKAQSAVDILIRNLYERTADVGFLATDDDIRHFVSNQSRNEDDVDYITDRLREYEEKYTVYEEIIILDARCNVLANLDENNDIAGKRIEAPALKKTLDSKKDFIEYFGFSPLQPQKKKAHIFSKKILDENTNKVAGILCLCFRFENEVKGIFEKLCTDYDGSVLTIIDKDDAVIASSDTNHVPIDIRVEPVSDNENVVYYRGVEYIAKTVSTSGYQGYYGLGWKGHIMIPLNLAFRDNAAETLNSIDHDIMSGLMSQADSFSVKLHNIMGETEKINYALKRIIYNGQIVARDKDVNGEYIRLGPILNSIRKTGSEICDIFDKSVKNLFATVISSGLREEKFLAEHCIDIMDRNLYERADDCRWWALNPVFKATLSKENLSGRDVQNLTGILKYINSLYTVYTVLFLFDKSGKIVAVSNPEYEDKIGMVVSDGYIKNIIRNNREDKYFVSQFGKNELYKDRHTYVYGASVTDNIRRERTVGGIGIVFDSEFQFETMLKESISSRENAFAVFADNKGNIISSTKEELKPGNALDLNKKFFKVKNGNSNSKIIVYDNSYYSVGYAASSGYREYKNSDGYKNDVIAFVFEKLADRVHVNKTEIEEEYIEQTDIPASANVKMFGTFLVDGHDFGLERSVIVEAIEKDGITSIPGSLKGIEGVVRYDGRVVPVLDMHIFCGRKRRKDDEYDLLLIKLKDGSLMALMVDSLVNVIEVGEDYILPTPITNGSASLIKNVVCPNGFGDKIMMIIDEQELLSFTGPEVKHIKIDDFCNEIKKKNKA